MTNKQALREAAVRAGGEKWHYVRTSVHSKAYITNEKGETVVNCTDGDAPAKCAVFIELANPATVLALLDELEAAAKQNAQDVQIKARLCRESNSLHDRLREAEKRIAELEAREVVLPQRISMEGGSYCTAHARYDEEGDFYYRDEVIESLVAAGIITRIED